MFLWCPAGFQRMLSCGGSGWSWLRGTKAHCAQTPTCALNTLSRPVSRWTRTVSWLFHRMLYQPSALWLWRIMRWHYADHTQSYSTVTVNTHIDINICASYFAGKRGITMLYRAIYPHYHKNEWHNSFFFRSPFLQMRISLIPPLLQPSSLYLIRKQQIPLNQSLVTLKYLCSCRSISTASQLLIHTPGPSRQWVWTRRGRPTSNRASEFTTR